MRSIQLWAILAGLSASHAFAADATVIMLRGSAKTDGGKILKQQDKVAIGATIKTEARSFVKILFPDNTQISLGPDTTMKLEPSQAGDPGIVNLVGGQIRAKVTKDLLKAEDGKGKEKMIIKTKSAAMGIRGTDFNVSFNQQNQVTALVTFEGNVAMAKVTDANVSPASLLAGGSEVQSVGPGQFCGAQPDLGQATVPVKISPAQLETMKGNETFSGVGEKATNKSEGMASPIPPGVNPKDFASGTEKLVADSVGAAAGEAAVATAKEATGGQTGGAATAPAEGSFNAANGTYAPRAGGFIDLASGRYIPPPPGSSFDPNTGVFTPPAAVGKFDPATGNYVPPKGVELDPVKGFVAEAPKAGAGANTPSATGAAGAPPPPPPQIVAMVAALNYTMRPDNAGKSVTFEKVFSPTAGPGMLPPPPPPPPPPPGSLPPPNGLLPPPKEPVDNPFCPTCQSQNLPPPPQNTTVQFNITVQ